MRIITDGKKYAVARYRWIFTEVMSPMGVWWNIRSSESSYFRCWSSLERAKELLELKKFKWKTYKEKNEKSRNHNVIADILHRYRK